VNQGRALRRRQAGGGDQLVVEANDPSVAQWPRIVEHRSAAQGAGRGGEQRPPGGEEVVERAKLVGLEPAPDLDVDRQRAPFGPGQLLRESYEMVEPTRSTFIRAQKYGSR